MLTNVICFPPMITFKANILPSIIWTESIISTLQFGCIRIATPSHFELFPLKKHVPPQSACHLLLIASCR